MSCSAEGWQQRVLVGDQACPPAQLMLRPATAAACTAGTLSDGFMHKSVMTLHIEHSVGGPTMLELVSKFIFRCIRA